MSDNYVLQYQYIRLIFGARYDFIQYFSTPAAARQLTKNLRTVLQRGGFCLTKFIANNSDALSAIPAEDRDKSASETKVLSQTWCFRTDSYTAPPPKTVDNPTTLSKLFSLVSSIFEPIGLLSPLVIQFKIIIQSLWKLGETWNHAIPNHIQTSVNKLTDSYHAMPTVSVPRRAFRSATTVELHLFTDASNSAFAAVIYSRQPAFSQTSAQQIFVIGKSRVLPIKQKSITKLELEAAVLGVRLLRKVRNAFSCTFRVVKFWTDSCVVLDWIQRQNKLKCFVAHRVNEITLHSDPLDWQYQMDQWSILLQRIGQKLAQTTANNLYSRRCFSTWSNPLKVAANVFRFVRRLRLPTSPSTLVSEEFRKANHALIKQSQFLSFASTFHQLRRNLNPTSRDKLIPFLPLIDQNSLLRRSHGRLVYAPLVQAIRFPLLLDSKEPITKLYLGHAHEICCHAGPEFVKAFVQQLFKIFDIRAALRSIDYRCFIYRRFRAEELCRNAT